jgi:hypothetical protein
MTKADSMTKQLALLDVFSMDDSLTGQLFFFYINLLRLQPLPIRRSL